MYVNTDGKVLSASTTFLLKVTKQQTYHFEFAENYFTVLKDDSFFLQDLPKMACISGVHPKMPLHSLYSHFATQTRKSVRKEIVPSSEQSIIYICLYKLQVKWCVLVY